MTCPAWRDRQHRPATSAPLPGSGPAGHTPAGLAAEHPLPQAHAAQQAQQHGGLQPASSAPMVLPGQPVELEQPQPAMSVSLSAQCDGPGAPGACLRIDRGAHHRSPLHQPCNTLPCCCRNSNYHMDAIKEKQTNSRWCSDMTVELKRAQVLSKSHGSF